MMLLSNAIIQCAMIRLSIQILLFYNLRSQNDQTIQSARPLCQSNPNFIVLQSPIPKWPNDTICKNLLPIWFKITCHKVTIILTIGMVGEYIIGEYCHTHSYIPVGNQCCNSLFYQKKSNPLLGLLLGYKALNKLL